MRDLTVASALLSLADLAAVHGSVRAALTEWPERAPDDLRPTLERLSARLRLGAPISHALGSLRSTMGPEGDLLKAIVKLHLATGTALPPLLRAIAERIGTRVETERRLAAGLAGVRASARLVAALPVVCIALLPLERSALSDPIGIALIGAGSAMGAVGFVWMRRAVPNLAVLDDPIGDMAELVAAALRVGTPIGAAFELAARGPLGYHRPYVERALRLARLGSRWHAALALTNHAPLEELAGVVKRASGMGTPLAPALDVWVGARRTTAAGDLERSLKRAPVRMIPPLTLCVLPAFILLGLGPFVRDLVRIV